MKVLAALNEAPLDANGRFKDYDFVSGLLRFLPLLVQSCAKVREVKSLMICVVRCC